MVFARTRVRPAVADSCESVGPSLIVADSEGGAVAGPGVTMVTESLSC